MSKVRASVAIFDGDGGETAAEGGLRVTTGDDPGTVALWVGPEGNVDAAMVINDLAAFKAQVAAL